MSDVETDLVKGLAAYLAAHSVGTYRATGAYTAAETAIVFGQLPTTPDRCIAITVYGAPDDEAVTPLSTLRVQFWCRGNANDNLDAGELAGAVFALLHGATYLTFGQANVSQILRVSRVTLGQDQNKRQERADSYEFTVDFPATAGRPG